MYYILFFKITDSILLCYYVSNFKKVLREHFPENIYKLSSQIKERIAFSGVCATVLHFFSLECGFKHDLALLCFCG